VERLRASRTPHVESAQMAASLADVRREIERSTPLPTLVSIERRLERIATRLDQEIAHPVQASFDAKPFDDLARRIDSVRDALESRPGPQLDTNRLEACLKELSARLESANTEPLAALMRGIGARLDVAGERDAENRSLAPLLEIVIDKLNQSHPAEASVGRQAIDEIAEEIARRLQNSVASRSVADLFTEQIAIIHDKVDALLESSGEPAALEPLVIKLMDKLRHSSSETASGDASSASQLNFAAELAGMRVEQADAERRTQLRLTGLQELIEKLVGRLYNVENEAGAEMAARQQAQNAGGPKASSNRSAEIGDSEVSQTPASFRQTFGANSLTTGNETSTEAQDGEEFLLEPGAGAPQRAQDARELARAIGLRTNPAVTAHIAAARRAAHAALAGPDRGPKTSPAVSSSTRVTYAKTFYDSHRRSVLLAVALAIVATVAVRLVGVHPPFLQGLGSEGKSPKAAGTDAPSGKRLDFAAGVKTEAGPIDTTPTASIATSSEPAKSNAAAGPLPPELITAIPVGLPQGLRDAVVAGSPGAQYELAQRLFEGRGVHQDQHAAALWFERAASLGFAPAQFRIGTLYQKGVGVDRDAAAAKRWYASAAEAGNARAAHNLAVMYAEPPGEKPDYAEAAKWFRKAAEMGVRDSQYNLAVLYARGLGVDQDFRQSWLWFSLAAGQGDTDAARKRDEVAAKMDPAALAAAEDDLAKFKAAKPNPSANDVPAPPGGWDSKPLSLAIPVVGGQRPRTTL
jgi:localization factor PodJL